ncbi:glycosyltransferase [Microbacterium lacticum]|uniref:glycosyltransferase n=1 Tax=Microbacterium lacticum TaxID=33885 RepID=UPI003A86E0CD
MRALFISGEIGGNVPPTLAIAAELARRGHAVTIAGLRPRAALPSGIVQVPLSALAGMDVRRKAGPLGHVPALARMGMGRAPAREVRRLLDEQNPDAVVVDGVMLTSLREALRESPRGGIPTAVLFHTLGEFWSRGMGNPVLRVVLGPFGLAPLALLDRAQARLLPADRELDPAARGDMRDSKIAFDWLGTTERAQPPAPREPGESPLVLVSLSSAWQRGQADLYRRVIRALASLPVRAIVTTGGVELDAELTLTPTPRVEVRGWASHAEIMPHADLVIGHGGHSTTLNSLAHGVPLRILPLDPTSDQPLLGRTVQDAGLGRTIRRSASADEIAAAVLGILTEPATAAAAARTGERLRAQDGASAGADVIERIAATP